jgi:hypothetical protein
VIDSDKTIGELYNEVGEYRKGDDILDLVI